MHHAQRDGDKNGSEVGNGFCEIDSTNKFSKKSERCFTDTAVGQRKEKQTEAVVLYLS